MTNWRKLIVKIFTPTVELYVTDKTLTLNFLQFYLTIRIRMCQNSSPLYVRYI